MTDLEKVAYNALLEVRACLTTSRIGRPDFQTMMGRVRDAIRVFENKASGCPTGLHGGKCTCKPPVVGVCKP